MKNGFSKPKNNSIEYICKYYFYDLIKILHHIFKISKKFDKDDASYFFKQKLYYYVEWYDLSDPKDFCKLNKCIYRCYLSRYLSLMNQSEKHSFFVPTIDRLRENDDKLHIFDKETGILQE